MFNPLYYAKIDFRVHTACIIDSIQKSWYNQTQGNFARKDDMMEYTDFTFESLGDGIEICISDEHRFGTDAFLLADFAQARRKDICADFCTGSGIIAMLLYKNYKPKLTYALEIQEKAHEQLKVSLKKSKIDSIVPVLGDLKDWRAEKELDLITCNPPYKINNTGEKNESEAVSIARHEMMCTVEDVCAAAKRSLKFGGKLCLCNRIDQRAALFVRFNIGVGIIGGIIGSYNLDSHIIQLFYCGSLCFLRQPLLFTDHFLI